MLFRSLTGGSGLIPMCRRHTEILRSASIIVLECRIMLLANGEVTIFLPWFVASP